MDLPAQAIVVEITEGVQLNVSGDVDRQLQGYLFSQPLPPEKFEALFIAPETALETMDTEISAQPQLIGL
jgi:hypothetical protein